MISGGTSVWIPFSIQIVRMFENRISLVLWQEQRNLSVQVSFRVDRYHPKDIRVSVSTERTSIELATGKDCPFLECRKNSRYALKDSRIRRYRHNSVSSTAGGSLMFANSVIAAECQSSKVCDYPDLLENFLLVCVRNVPTEVNVCFDM